MKRSIIWACALAVWSVVSCTMEKDVNVPVGSGQLEFHAVWANDPGTRTVLQSDGKSVWWTPEEEINVFLGNQSSGKFTSTNTADQALATFEGTLTPLTGTTGQGSEAAAYWAVYPYNESNTCDGNSVTLTVPAVQGSKAGTFADKLLPAVATSHSMDLAFYNVCGGVRFSVSHVGLVSVTFKALGGEPLVGKARVGFGPDGYPVVSEITEGSSEVTVNAPSGGFVPGQYYFAVFLPQTLSQGLSMTFKTKLKCATYTKDNRITVNRSRFGMLDGKDEGLTFVKRTDLPVPEAIDLGLPSGMLWASFNLGASAPEEYGDHYAWGETEPHYWSLNPLTWNEGKETGYNWETYQWCMGSSRTFTKYCRDYDVGYQGFRDNKAILDLEDDAAHVALGGQWRMPTIEELHELRDKCTWVKTSINGKSGVLGTGPNGNTIFLPLAGSRWDKTLNDAGTYGRYWSSQLCSPSQGQLYAYNVMIIGGSFESMYSSDSRPAGESIRPVYDPRTDIPVESVSLNEPSMIVKIGTERTLVANVLPFNAADKSVTWSSNNESVATVSSTGVVAGVAAGLAVITATTNDGGKTATCKVTVHLPELETVDLGLPSGLKWASFNLGSSTIEGYGGYYAWGETEPYYSSLNPLTWKEGKSAGYDWKSYQWCEGTNKTLTKYCRDYSYGYQGFRDNKNVLDLEDDAANSVLGGRWRMPTNDEVTELKQKCTWRWVSMNNTTGMLVTGPNGASIFLPAAGYRYGTRSDYAGSEGRYWSSNLGASGTGEHYAYYLNFTTSSVGSGSSSTERFRGFTIRPVIDSRTDIPVESVSLNEPSMIVKIGTERTLVANVLPSNAADKSVTWSSSNESVATVSPTGVVTGVTAGLAVITANTNGGAKTATCKVTVNSLELEAVDLGLPSGLKWASFNLGASSPTGYGSYYAWGETEPYYSSLDPLTWKDGKEAGYDWTSYHWCAGTNKTMLKYCTRSTYGYEGLTDDKTVLNSEDDAAHKALGGQWRMPTNEEISELKKNCTWRKISMYNTTGVLGTGPNGASIFLPANGYRSGTSRSYAGSEGFYWSSSLYRYGDDQAYSLHYTSSVDKNSQDYTSRCRGLAIRPVFSESE